MKVTQDFTIDDLKAGSKLVRTAWNQNKIFDWTIGRIYKVVKLKGELFVFSDDGVKIPLNKYQGDALSKRFKLIIEEESKMKKPRTTRDYEVKDIKAGDKLLRLDGDYEWWTENGVYEVERLHGDLVIFADDNDWYFVDDEDYIRDNFELVVEPPKEEVNGVGVVDFCVELLEDIERCDMTRNEIKMYLAGIVAGAEGEYK